MSSNAGTITTATRYFVLWAHPNMLEERGGEFAAKRTIYNVMSYNLYNFTLIAALVMGIVAPILTLISFTAAAWWVTVPLILRFLIFKELVQIEVCGKTEMEKSVYLIARIFGGLKPDAANHQQVLRHLGHDPQQYPHWKIELGDFLGFEVRRPGPSLAVIAQGAAIARVGNN